jgi:hypothetical protein
MEISSLGASKEWSDSLETRFFYILSQANRYEVNEYGLSIYADGMGGALHFEACNVTDPTRGDSVDFVDPVQVTLGDTFKLQTGRYALAGVNGIGVYAGFVGVLEDGRCPLGTHCPWAGDAVVTVAMGGTDTIITADLHTNESVGRRTMTAQGYDLELLELSPYPQPGIEIAPDAYKVTLRVTKH